MEGWIRKICVILYIITMVVVLYYEFPKNMDEAPEDIINEKDIHLNGNTVTVNIPEEYETRWVTFTDTNSMLPTFDYGHHIIEIKCPCSIKVGDIVSFNYEDKIIIHRVVKIDFRGRYKTKGDNIKETIWVNEEDIIGKAIMVVY